MIRLSPTIAFRSKSPKRSKGTVWTLVFVVDSSRFLNPTSIFSKDQVFA